MRWKGLPEVVVHDRNLCTESQSWAARRSMGSQPGWYSRCAVAQRNWSCTGSWRGLGGWLKRACSRVGKTAGWPWRPHPSGRSSTEGGSSGEGEEDPGCPYLQQIPGNELLRLRTRGSQRCGSPWLVLLYPHCSHSSLDETKFKLIIMCTWSLKHSGSITGTAEFACGYIIWAWPQWKNTSVKNTPWPITECMHACILMRFSTWT